MNLSLAVSFPANTDPYANPAPRRTEPRRQPSRGNLRSDQHLTEGECRGRVCVQDGHSCMFFAHHRPVSKPCDAATRTSKATVEGRSPFLFILRGTSARIAQKEPQGGTFRSGASSNAIGREHEASWF